MIHEERLRELELWFVGCHIPYVGSQRDTFISKMKKVDSDYARDVVAKIQEYWLTYRKLLVLELEENNGKVTKRVPDDSNPYGDVWTYVLKEFDDDRLKKLDKEFEGVDWWEEQKGEQK